MPCLCIIILNYNTWKLTIEMVQSLEQIVLPKEHEIVVVDNCSTNGSREELVKWNIKNHKYTLLCAKKNVGYASGNNIGLRYAKQNGFKYAWVINNDILFPDKKISSVMLNCFEQSHDIAAVSPRVFMPTGKEVSRQLFRPTFWDESFGCIAFRIKASGLKKKLEQEKKWCYTYRPQGCCMMMDVDKIAAISYMDEETFLYCEEPILAERLLSKGYRCACALQTKVTHNHSSTVNDNVSLNECLLISKESVQYLRRHYYHYTKYQLLICEWFDKLLRILRKQRAGEKLNESI